MNLQDIVMPIADFIVWTFDNILVTLGDLPVNPNDIFLLMGFVGLFIWLRFQIRFNKEAEANPDQIK